MSPASLVFTTDNWNAPQTVTVKGVDDKVQDGNQPYFIRTSAAISKDAGYSGLDPQDVAVTILNETPADGRVNAVEFVVTDADRRPLPPDTVSRCIKAPALPGLVESASRRARKARTKRRMASASFRASSSGAGSAPPPSSGGGP